MENQRDTGSSSNGKVLFTLKEENLLNVWKVENTTTNTLSLSMMLQILRAGPNLRPKYFMSMVVLSNSRAFPGAI